MKDTEHQPGDRVAPCEGAGELEAIQHDLKNMLTALSSGCMLIDAKLGNDGNGPLREIVAEMRSSIQGGRATVERLQQMKLNVVPASPASSGSPTDELAE